VRSLRAQSHKTIPYFIPFRALTHVDASNLLVAGKTMAQVLAARRVACKGARPR
jgi:hypothetical protein